jgi:hypothetical protein
VPEQRDANGVRIRADGKGDGWAQAHRDELGPTYNMSDLDGYVGLVGFAGNTGDRLFMEYVPDNYANKGKTVRRFATVALFDRKASRDYAFSEANAVSLAFYLDLCRRLGETQPKPPKFFFIIGRQATPWELVELDIQTGQIISEFTLQQGRWRVFWEAVGLVALRGELRTWIDPASANKTP